MHVALRELLYLELSVTSLHNRTLNLPFRMYSSSLKERGNSRLKLRSETKGVRFIFVTCSGLRGLFWLELGVTSSLSLLIIEQNQVEYYLKKGGDLA